MLMKTLSKIKSDVVTMTPKWAAELLEKVNNLQRPISQSLVNRYIEDMKSTDGWCTNGQTVSIALDGTIINGHHRLWACVQGDVPFETVIVTGIADTRRAYLTSDVGKGRKASDMIYGVSGIHKNHQKIAAAALLCLRYNNNKVATRKVFTQEQVTNYSDAHPDLETFVDLANKRDMRSYATQVGAALYLASAKYRVRAMEFLEQIVTGVDLGAGSPALALRSRLQGDSAKGVRNNPEERFALAILAWNAYVDGRKIVHLRVPNDTFPKIRGATY